jgi:hypothetical protein
MVAACEADIVDWLLPPTHPLTQKQTKERIPKHKTISSSLHMLQLLFQTDNHNS